MNKETMNKAVVKFCWSNHTRSFRLFSLDISITSHRVKPKLSVRKNYSTKRTDIANSTSALS